MQRHLQHTNRMAQVSWRHWLGHHSRRKQDIDLLVSSRYAHSVVFLLPIIHSESLRRNSGVQMLSEYACLSNYLEAPR